MCRFIILKEGTTQVPVRVEEVVRFEGMGSYTNVHLKNGKMYMQCKYIGYWEDKVKETGLFMRLHKSHLVQHSLIFSFNKTSVTLKDNSRLDISGQGYISPQELFT